MQAAAFEKLSVRRACVNGFLATAVWVGFQSVAQSLAKSGSLPATSFG